MKRIKFFSERIKRIGSAITAMVVLTAVFPKECISANIESQPYTWIVKGIEAEDIYTSDLYGICTTNLELKYSTLLAERYSIIKTDNGYNCIDYLGNTLLEEWCSDKIFYRPRGDIAGFYPEVNIERGESGLVFYDELGGYGGDIREFAWDNQNSYRCLVMPGPNDALNRADYSIYISLDQNIPCEFYDNGYTGKYVLASGNEIISDEFYDRAVYGFRSDIYAFEKDGFWYYLNQEGESVLDFGVKTIVNEMDYDVCPHLFTDGYVVVSDSNGYSLYDETGKQVIKPGTFNKINPVYNGYAWVQDSETKLWGVIKLNDYTPKEQPDESWRYIYEKKLCEIMTEVDSSSAYGWRKFSLEYITDDSVPELVVSGGTFRGPYYTVYTIENNEIKELATGGSFSYLTGKSTLITQNRSGMYTDTTIYDMKNEKTISLVSGAEYKLDGQTITADEFQDLINSYVINVLYAEVQSGYEVNEQNIDHVLQLDKLRIIEKFSTDLLPEIDPDVQAHIDWLDNNFDDFEYIDDSSLMVNMKSILLNNADVDRYKFLQNYCQDMSLTENGELAEKYTIELILAEIFNSPEFKEGLEEAANEKLYSISRVAIDTLSIIYNSKYGVKDGLDDCKDFHKNYEQIVNMKKELNNLSGKARLEKIDEIKLKYIDTFENAFKYKGLVDEIADILGPIFDHAPISLDYINTADMTNDEYYRYVVFNSAYEGQTEYTKKALEYLIQSISIKGNGAGGRSIDNSTNYANLNSTINTRQKLLEDALKTAYSNITVSQDKLNDKYRSLLLVETEEYIKDTFDVLSKFIVVTLITAVAPEIGVVIAIVDIVDAGASIIASLEKKLEESNSNIKELAFTRDIALNMMIIYDGITDAMRYNMSEDLRKNKDLDSLAVFECGMEMYRKIHNLTYKYVNEYIILFMDDMNKTLMSAQKLPNLIGGYNSKLMKEFCKCYGSEELVRILGCEHILKNPPTDYQNKDGDFDILLFCENYNISKYERSILESKLCLITVYYKEISDKNLKLNEFRCHNDMVEISYIDNITPDFNCYTIACPVNVEIINKSGNKIAEIKNDVEYFYEAIPTCSITSINDGESDYNSKVIIAPLDYDVEITGYADGTMYFEKAIVENGSLSAVSTITDVPVQNGSSYTEVVKNDTTVALDCDLDGDGMKDETLSAEVSKFDESNDESNVPTLMAESISGKAGEIIELDVKLLNNPGIIALCFDIEYDNTKLKLLGAEDGKILGDSTSTFGNDLAMIPYRLAWDDAANKDNTSNGTVAKLKFEILETADTGKTEVKIKLNQGSTFNVELEGVEFATVSGMVNIGEYTEATTTTSPVITTETVTGDVNNDGIVSIVDLIKLVQHILKPEVQINSQNSDMNSDGKINLTDVVELKKLFLR